MDRLQKHQRLTKNDSQKIFKDLQSLNLNIQKRINTKEKRNKFDKMRFMTDATNHILRVVS